MSKSTASETMREVTRELTQGLRKQHEGATAQKIKSLVTGTLAEVWMLISKQYAEGKLEPSEMYPTILKLVYVREAANAAMDSEGPDGIAKRAVDAVEGLIEKIVEEDQKATEDRSDG